MSQTSLNRCRLTFAATIVAMFATVSHAAEIAHYTFDNTFNDSSTSMNHLSVASGTPGFTSTAGEFAFGGAGLDTDGTNNEWLALNSPITFSNTDAWTISFWGRRRTGADFRAGMIAGEVGTGVDFIWIPDNFQGFRFRSSTNNTEDFVAPKDDVLRHFALVADGAGNLDLYINGVFSESESGNTSFELANIAHGFNQTIHSLDGNIDEFFVFDEALDATQIANLQQFNNINGAAIPEPATWAIWGMLGAVAVCFGLYHRRTVQLA